MAYKVDVKEKPHLEFYKKCMTNNLMMPRFGLCSCTDDEIDGVLSCDILEMFRPAIEDRKQLENDNLSISYWGSGVSQCDPNRFSHFTTLRQTIVLFMAAINNEL